MTTPRRLRRAAADAERDPFWNNVSLLFKVNGTNTTRDNRAVTWRNHNNAATAFESYGVTVGFSSRSPFNNDFGSLASWNTTQSTFLNFPTGITQLSIASDFTLEFWAMIPSGTSQTGNDNRAWQSGTGALSLGIIDGAWRLRSGGTSITGSIPNATDGSWRHIVLMRSGTTLTAYANGSQFATTTLSGTVDFNGMQLITAGSTQFRGYISNFRLSNTPMYSTSGFQSPNSRLSWINGSTRALFYGDEGVFYDYGPQRIPVMQRGSAQPTTGLAAQIRDSSIRRFTGVDTIQGLTTGNSEDAFLLPPTNSTFFTTDSLVCPGDYTWETWYRIPTGVTQPTIAMFAWNDIGPFELRSNSSAGANRINLNGPGITSTTDVRDSLWHHLAVVRTGTASGNVRMYIDGQLIGSGTNTTSVQFTGNTNPGRMIGSANGFFVPPGNFDSIRITKGVARYTANFTAPIRPFPTL
jgi:hypothetical protein